MLEKFNVTTILDVESNRMIRVFVSPIMSLFIILLSFTLSLTCFERDITL